MPGEEQTRRSENQHSSLSLKDPSSAPEHESREAPTEALCPNSGSLNDSAQDLWNMDRVAEARGQSSRGRDAVHEPERLTEAHTVSSSRRDDIQGLAEIREAQGASSSGRDHSQSPGSADKFPGHRLDATPSTSTSFLRLQGSH